jgi:hypothetical protein
MSYMNSSFPPIPFIPPSPKSWNSFNRYHFCIYIPVYTVFAMYSLSYPPFPTPLQYQPAPLGNNSFASCSPILQKREKRKVKKENMTFLLV